MITIYPGPNNSLLATAPINGLTHKLQDKDVARFYGGEDMIGINMGAEAGKAIATAFNLNPLLNIDVVYFDQKPR